MSICYFLNIFMLYFFVVVIKSEEFSENMKGSLNLTFRRAYNNPYHPEDDGNIENISDEDGDNLKFGGKVMGQLSDSERGAETKKLLMKRLKINGKFFDDTHNAPDSI